MTTDDQEISYPRLRVRRFLARLLGRLLLPVIFRVRIFGKENFPPSGPLIVVGNHTAIMEVVMMVVFSPWQVEILGGGDIPHERISDLASRFFGYIPYIRGHLDRPSVRKAQAVLDQGGILGIFPEGGIWQTTERRVQPGVAWLSEKCKAPVLPIYFSGARGALSGALKLKRPKLSMHVGKVIPAAQIPPNTSSQGYFSDYAWAVMERVDELRPDSDVCETPKITNECFLLELAVAGRSGEQLEIPSELEVKHPEALAKLLHYPSILKIFAVNLKMPVRALMNLSSQPTEDEILVGCRSILQYLSDENPYLLTYRFGSKEGDAMRLGIVELEVLTRWALDNGNRLMIRPIHRYFDIGLGKEIVQIEQGKFQGWM